MCWFCFLLFPDFLNYILINFMNFVLLDLYYFLLNLPLSTFWLLNISTIHTATILWHSSCAIQSSLLRWIYYVPCRNIKNNLFYSHKIKTIKIILWDSMVLCIPLTECFLLRPDMQHNTSYVVTFEIVPFTDHHCQIADLVWHSLTSATTITRLSILEIKSQKLQKCRIISFIIII